MSMSMSLYIGPYLKCRGRGMDIWDATEERLHYLRGEYSREDPEDVHYIGPNMGLDGIERKMEFDQYNSDPAVIEEIDRQKEIDAFMSQYAVDVEMLRRHYLDMEVKWGVVPGFF